MYGGNGGNSEFVEGGVGWLRSRVETAQRLERPELSSSARLEIEHSARDAMECRVARLSEDDVDDLDMRVLTNPPRNEVAELFPAEAWWRRRP